MISAAIYDEQAPGSRTGPIRWVAGFTSQEALDAVTQPYVLLGPGDALGMTSATHHVVNGDVVALDGAPPPVAAPILSPHPPPDA